MLENKSDKKCTRIAQPITVTELFIYNDNNNDPLPEMTDICS